MEPFYQMSTPISYMMKAQCCGKMEGKTHHHSALSQRCSTVRQGSPVCRVCWRNCPGKPQSRGRGRTARCTSRRSVRGSMWWAGEAVARRGPQRTSPRRTRRRTTSHRRASSARWSSAGEPSSHWQSRCHTTTPRHCTTTPPSQTSIISSVELSRRAELALTVALSHNQATAPLFQPLHCITTSTTPLHHYFNHCTAPLLQPLHCITASTTPLHHYFNHCNAPLLQPLHCITTSTTPLHHYFNHCTAPLLQPCLLYTSPSPRD